MSSRNRGILILELLAGHPWGLSAKEISTKLDIPISATSRVLLGLSTTGYIHGTGKTDAYRLRPRLAAVGLAFLGASGVTDLVQPVLDDLAKKTGELVRLAVTSIEALTWVAKSQGARSGLLYDPEASTEVYLPASANGQAWLSCLGDADVKRLVGQQGFERTGFGPSAPRNLSELQERIEATRRSGYATVRDSYAMGTTAMAAPIRRMVSADVIGTLSVTGPSIRMPDERVIQIAPWLKASARELAIASASSPLFTSQ